MFLALLTLKVEISGNYNNEEHSENKKEILFTLFTFQMEMSGNIIKLFILVLNKHYKRTK